MKLEELKGHLTDCGYAVVIREDGTPLLRGPGGILRDKFIKVLKRYRDKFIEESYIPWKDGVVGRIVNEDTRQVIYESVELLTEGEFCRCVDDNPSASLYGEHRLTWHNGEHYFERTFSTNADTMS